MYSWTINGSYTKNLEAEEHKHYVVREPAEKRGGKLQTVTYLYGGSK